MDFANPYIPNALNSVYAAQAGFDTGNKMRVQNALSEAGQYGANNDFEGMAKSLFRAGLPDEAMKSLNTYYSKVGNLALLADTPDKWATMIQGAKAAGLPIDKYQDFGSRSTALAQAGMAQDVINNELKRRQLALSEGQFGLNQTRQNEELNQQHISQAAGVAQNIASQTDAGKQQAMWQQLYNSDPRISQILQANGIGPNDYQAGTQFLMRRAQGFQPPQKLSAGEEVFDPVTGQKLYANTQLRYGGAPMAEAAALQNEFKAKYGKDLPIGLALSTQTLISAKYGAGAFVKGWQFDENGNPTQPIIDVVPGSAADLRRQQLGVAQQRVDPNQVYNRSLATAAGKTDAQNAAREAQAVIVDRHTNLAADVAGGWELDNSKLTPEQLAQRQNFEASIGGIRGNIPKTWQTIKGEIAPDAETPAVVRELSAINQMMKAEVTRLATTGQGQVAEGVRKEFDDVVGNFLTNPSTKTYLQTLAFTKKMMGEFKNVPNTGYEQLQRMQGKPAVSPGQNAQPRQTATGPNGHKIGYFDDKGWVDLQTGQPVQ